MSFALLHQTGSNCGLLIFLGRLPQAPSRRQPAAPPFYAHPLRHKRHSVPPKSQNACCKSCERMPPPKPPLTAVVEPDPIYPHLPFLFCSPYWQRTCHEGSKATFSDFVGLFGKLREDCIVVPFQSRVFFPYVAAVQPTDNRSDRLK